MATFVHIRNISAVTDLILTQLCRIWGPCLKESNCHGCHGNICPGNICPGDICPYQQYLICYWTNFDQLLNVGFWGHVYQMPCIRWIIRLDIFLGLHLFGPKKFMNPIIAYQNLGGPKCFCTQSFYEP